MSSETCRDGLHSELSLRQELLLTGLGAVRTFVGVSEAAPILESQAIARIRVLRRDLAADAWRR